MVIYAYVQDSKHYLEYRLNLANNITTDIQLSGDPTYQKSTSAYII